MVALGAWRAAAARVRPARAGRTQDSGVPPSIRAHVCVPLRENTREDTNTHKKVENEAKRYAILLTLTRVHNLCAEGGCSAGAVVAVRWLHYCCSLLLLDGAERQHSK